jgi:hypothetical protein
MTNALVGVAVFSGFFLAMLLSLQLGRLGSRQAIAGAKPPGLGAIETVIFGLLGLLLAFTFSGAASRLDVRRTLIVDEANAIGTAWLRLDVLPAAEQPKLRDAFRRYTDSRIAIYRMVSFSGIAAARAELSRAAGIQNEIWAAAVAATEDAQQARVTLLPALNEMFDITTTRVAATQMHPPFIVYIVLTLLSLACCFLVGYEVGTSAAASWPHIVVFAMLLALTLYVIIDFEYPRLGMIRVDDFDSFIAQVRASMG